MPPDFRKEIISYMGYEILKKCDILKHNFSYAFLKQLSS
jgi:hypothetical protein